MPDTSSQPGDVVVTRVGRRVELNMSSHPATLRPVRVALEEFGREAGLTAAQADEIGLALNEALANVMRHGYGGAEDKPILVSFELHGGDKGDGEVEVRIRDWAKPFDPAKLPWDQAEAKAAKPPDPDEVKPGGLGLMCMRRLMDVVSFTPQSDGMLLTMVKKLRRSC